MKSSFFREEETKKKLADFLFSTSILSMSEQCKKFELSFAKKQESKYAVFVSSGSMANLILIQSLLNQGKLKKGQKVGFSSLTWATNVMPLIQLGLVPVPIDCELETLNVSIETLSRKAEDLSALFLTNVLGLCDNLVELKKFCEEKNLLLLEDNCESLGSKIGGKLLGSFGLASTFSFFVGHHLSTIEGGMICTNDEELYEMLVMVRAHGWDRNLSVKKQNQLRGENNIPDFFGKYSFYELAFNGRPTEINGFLGNEQLKFWEQIVNERELNFFRFQEVINNNTDLFHLNTSHMETISNFAMPVVCKTKELWILYKEHFENAGVEIRPLIAGDMTRQPFYKKYVHAQVHCKNSNLIHEQGFYFPNNPELIEQDIELLCSLLKNK